jgi:hypothetical protein
LPKPAVITSPRKITEMIYISKQTALVKAIPGIRPKESKKARKYSVNAPAASPGENWGFPLGHTPAMIS